MLPGRKVNVAMFGTVRATAAEGKDQAIEVEWRQPRDIIAVILRGPKLPEASRVEVQYWYRIWPDNGRGGWMRLDDPFNGKWVTAKTDAAVASEKIELRLLPLDSEENPEAKLTGFDYRRTYRIRVVFDSSAEVSEVECLTAAEWRSADIKIEWKPNSQPEDKRPEEPDWTTAIEARNGRIVSIAPEKGGAVVGVEYAHSPDRLSEDRGYVVFRAPEWDGFSVFVDDVLREGGIYVRDIDAFVSDAAKGLSYATWDGPEGEWDATVMAKVARMPEQSLQRVMEKMPAKAPREAHLGVANMRQEFTISPAGNIELLHMSLRGPGQDADRRPWTERELKYALATGASPGFGYDRGRSVKRWLEENYLPVIRCEWTTEGIRYKQSALATTLLAPIGEREDARKGDETLILLERIEMQNTTDSEQTAWLWLELSRKGAMRMDERGVMVLDAPSDGTPRPGLTPVRGRIDTNGRGDLAILPDYEPALSGSPDPSLADGASPRQVVRYAVKLGPGEKHAVFLSITYIELLTDEELNALASQRYDDRYSEVIDYWRKRINAGMLYEVPEPILNDLYKANFWHMLITTDRDPETGLYEHGAATMRYPIYANETGMVAQSLEMRGEHAEAMRLLEPFIVSQGARPLPGNFRSQAGLFYAAYPYPDRDCYTAQGYNMHHGWALWNLCEHYKWTRDTEYLKSIAPGLVAGCDWVTRERQATKVMNPDGTRPVEWGLAPAGDLEDVEEYLYFYATNAYYHIGMKTAAEVLGEIDHPEAERLAKDAEEYAADILESARESTTTSPVVRLKDGAYVPYPPPRAYALTHLKEGWIREGLYPALHLLDANLVEPRHRIVTWLLEDLEDNVFLSEESGYKVDDQAAKFFDFGGFNLQPNLLCNSHAHLRRDEVPHFLRVFFNECWASLYPDTMCFAEWVPDFGKGGGPLYKTPDECKFIQYMRNMLIFEEGTALKLGMGVPRAWMENGKRVRIERAATFFGPMDMMIESGISRGRVIARLALPTRNPAKAILLRLRHPHGKPMRRVLVNGATWEHFDPELELVFLPEEMSKVEVAAEFA